MRQIAALFACMLMMTALSGCVVYPAHPHPQAYWVPGHYGPYGGWHPGHWQ
jgi:hypothetical protein